MRKVIVKALLTFLLIILACTPVFAHSAKKIELKWDQTNSVLDVSILHPVSNPATHYISKIVLTMNGKVIEEKKLTSQSDAKYSHDTFIIKDAQKGTKIEVEATCNVFGKSKESIIL